MDSGSSSKKVVLWNREMLSEALGVDIPFDFEAFDICINSKIAKPGDLFFGIEGPKYKGSHFANEAIQKGAVACLVDKWYDSLEEKKENVIRVSNVLQTLQKIASHRRQKFKGIVIGVTGSCGKTTTKEMMRSSFRPLGEVFASEDNLNSQVGLPYCIAKTPIHSKVCIYEMGMSIPGELTELSRIARPDISIVTSISAAHLQNFKSLEEIAEAKSEIFLGQVPGRGTVVLNCDHQYHSILEEKARKIGLKVVNYGKSSKADVRLVEQTIKQGYSEIRVDVFGEVIEYKLNTINEHLVMNSLSIFAVGSLIGTNLSEIAENMDSFCLLDGRGKVHNLKENIVLIDESYNASPDAMKCVLKSHYYYKKERKCRLIAILGDMKELGPSSLNLHRGILNDLISSQIDIVFTCGEMMKYLFDELPVEMRGGHFSDSNELNDYIVDLIRRNDAVLVKGSNSMKMSIIVRNIVQKFGVESL